MSKELAKGSKFTPWDGDLSIPNIQAYRIANRVINPTHYRCKKCGFGNTCDAFGYLGLSTIHCCPECEGTDLQCIRVNGDGSVVEESGS